MTPFSLSMLTVIFYADECQDVSDDNGGNNVHEG